MKVIYILSLLTLLCFCRVAKSQSPNDISQAEEISPKVNPLSNRVTDCLGTGYDWTKSIIIGVKQCREDILDIESMNRDGLIKTKHFASNNQTESGNGESAFSEEELVEEISGRFKIRTLFARLSLKADILNKVRSSQSSSVQIWYSNIIEESDVVYLNMEQKDLKKYLRSKFKKDITEKSGEEILRLYGTHLLTNVVIGGKQQIFQINTQQSHEHQDQKGLNLEANGSYGIVSAMGQYQKNQQQTNHASSFSNHMHCVAYGYKGGKCGSSEADYVFIDVASDKPLSGFIDIKDLIEDQEKINEISSILANKNIEQIWQALGLKWILIKGGSFVMGGEGGEANELPAHTVNVRDFYMSKTEVTVGQYRKCVEAGVCSKANSCVLGSFNWSDSVGSRENHPINCVDWAQARAFAKWVGGDLPSEAQWEYAARSGGRDIKYPWGNEEASCEYAVMDDGGKGCGQWGTWGVCSKTGDNTAQGLCDMGGNVREWVLDEWYDSYSGAPADDSGWCSDRGCSSNTSAARVSRGGSWLYDASDLRSARRLSDSPGYRNDNLGFRVSRSVP